MSIKLYLRDFNNVLSPLKDRFKLCEDPREADALVLWQDVRGDMAELCRINKEYMHKPVVVVQHGRGATNDYLPPNKFPLLADKICVWGKSEYDRMARAGYADKTVITGSPLVSYIKQRNEHSGKNIVFVPVITNHEEPDNINIYWHLKTVELNKSRKKLMDNYDALRKGWHAWEVEPTSATEGSIPYYNFNKDWRLLAKLTSVHDKRLYVGDVVQTQQINRKHLEDCAALLTMIDCVVGVEEGTFPLLAMAMDIPCVMVDGFSYREYGDIDYSSVEMIKTNAVKRVKLEDVEAAIDQALAHPELLRQERKQVVNDEFWDGTGDPIVNIENVIKETYHAYQIVHS
jgi:hypothetical protein